jgi:hypothetical protein
MKERKVSSRSISPRTLVLTAGAVAVVVLLFGTQVPQLVAGANAFTASSGAAMNHVPG